MMRSKMTWFTLILGALLALALFQPAFAYAGQIVPGHLALGTVDSSAAVILAAHGHGGGRGGGMAIHGGGGGWHGGGHFRHFYGGRTYVQPYYAEPYYVEPYCDNSVWDSDLNQWVCYDTDFD